MSQQQIITSPLRDVPPLVTEAPPATTKLDKEWETFNEIINLEGQIPKTPVSSTQVAKEVVSSIVSHVTEKEHVPVASSSEFLLNVEEIPPLDVFYSPQHKAVVRRKEN